MFFDNIALGVPKILLPKPEINCEKWAVIACDQYVHDRSYWEEVERVVGDAPSTLALIYPEVYLSDDGHEERIDRVHRNMKRFVAARVFREEIEGFLLVDRVLPSGKSRKGLVVALDLEHYDSRSQSKTLIRTTEGTYPKNLEARLEVRGNASLECPHILVLIDDPNREIIDPLFEEGHPTIADFDLMMHGGRLAYRLISRKADLARIAQKLAARIAPEYIREKYGIKNETLLYAMGDGNHSFAAAQKAWERIKSTLGNAKDATRHPARYAMVELVNLHDDAIDIEPIHRLITRVNPLTACNAIVALLNASGAQARLEAVASPEARDQRLSALASESTHCLPYRVAGGLGILVIENPSQRTIPETMEAALELFTRANPEAEVGFIHGADVIDDLGNRPDALGFYLPPISKDSVFESLVRYGAYPRKSISIGHADEKRYYMECRSLGKSAPSPPHRV